MSTEHTQKLAYSIREACDASSLGKTTIYALIGQGRLHAVRIGGRTVIPAKSLNDLVGMRCAKDALLGGETSAR